MFQSLYGLRREGQETGVQCLIFKTISSEVSGLLGLPRCQGSPSFSGKCGRDNC